MLMRNWHDSQHSVRVYNISQTGCQYASARWPITIHLHTFSLSLSTPIFILFYFRYHFLAPCFFEAGKVDRSVCV